MSDGMRIDGDYKVKNRYEDYKSTGVKPADEEFKKKLNSIHVSNNLAYMPAGGIGNLLNGSATQNTDGAFQA